MQGVACAACVCWESCVALFMHVLMVGTRELVQKQHSERESQELIVFMLAALAQMRLQVANDSITQQPFFGFLSV